ncbi:MAG: Transcriptional regulator, AcrR family [uncultured Chloroflexia bacterium]|uniref:Transcriptional regulator, AcrR family n=1 Tax=uncultured Chloroflexia bacterium TaxID=1672391 RepID=A0A6J4JQH7_9CHLR|nr:MAG: Transcriptional regulator, AcrR family [uncultured Chloroflexia bacterium]
MLVSRKKDGSDEAARSLALLWGSHSKTGRSGLNLRAIVTAAIELADAETLEEVSMRRVAERLNVGAMSLYTHVPGKVELTYLMIDTVYSELYADVDEPSRQPGGWRGALEFIAARNWRLYERHPWLLYLINTRPVLGPNASLKYEAELRPLDKLGLQDIEMDAILTLTLMHIEGTARAHANLLRTQRDTGMSDAEWWIINSPLLEKVINTKHFPVASRVGVSAGMEHQSPLNPEHAFTFGLERIFDGVALLIARREQVQTKEIEQSTRSVQAQRGRQR